MKKENLENYIAGTRKMLDIIGYSKLDILKVEYLGKVFFNIRNFDKKEIDLSEIYNIIFSKNDIAEKAKSFIDNSNGALLNWANDNWEYIEKGVKNYGINDIENFKFINAIELGQLYYYETKLYKFLTILYENIKKIK